MQDNEIHLKRGELLSFVEGLVMLCKMCWQKETPAFITDVKTQEIAKQWQVSRLSTLTDANQTIIIVTSVIGMLLLDVFYVPGI